MSKSNIPLPALDLSDVGSAVRRCEIDAKHLEWAANQELWSNVQTLYEGGAAIKAVAERFLKRRPKEDNTVFQHRLDQFNYENNIGAGLGWHEAAMFEADPSIDIHTKLADGNTDPDGKITPDQDAFYNQRFLKDCDRKGTTYIDLFRRVFTNILLYQRCFVAVDLPAREDETTGPRTLQDERNANLLDPYLCVLTPLDVINWECDAYGNLLWAVVYSRTQKRDFLKKPQAVERWYYYDRQQYRVYESMGSGETHATPEDAGATTEGAAIAALDSIVAHGQDKTPVKLVRIGYHPLASRNVVPIFKIEVQSGWWMANRVYLPAMKHININISLEWSLFMAGLAVPVLITDDDIATITQSETGFLKLGKGSDYKFAEPTGRAWEWLDKKAHSLKEEIWRGMYLVSQARNTSATAMAASGVSKQQDMQPSHDVLNGIGDVLRAGMQMILGWVAQARAALPGFTADENLTFDVRGFTFEDKLSVDDINIIQDLLAMKVPSNLFEKEMFILAVRTALKDINPDQLQKIIEEIKKAPTAEERAQQQQANDQSQMEQQQRRQMTALMKDDPEGVSPDN